MISKTEEKIVRRVFNFLVDVYEATYAYCLVGGFLIVVQNTF